MKKIKIYRATCGRGRDSKLIFTKSSSIKEATIKMRTFSRVGITGVRIASIDEAKEFSDISLDCCVYKDIYQKRSSNKHLREHDFICIGAVALINSAEKILHGCDISNVQLSQRLRNIRAELKDLEIDLKEDINERYRKFEKNIS